MLKSITNPIVQAHSKTNPEDRPTSIDLPTQYPEEASSADLLQETDADLLSQLVEANEGTTGRQDVESQVHGELFERALTKVLAWGRLEDRLCLSQQLQHLTLTQREIVNSVQRLKKAKSPNIELVKFVRGRIDQIIRGKELSQEAFDQSFQSRPVLSQLLQSFRRIQNIVKKDDSTLQQQIQRHCRQSDELLLSFQKQNKALTEKQRIAAQKAKEAQADLKRYLAENIKLNNQLKSMKQRAKSDLQTTGNSFAKDLAQLQQLSARCSNSRFVYAHIGVTIQDLKALILKLNSHNAILAEEKQLIQDKLASIEQQFQHSLSSQSLATETNLEQLRLTVTHQQRIIADLESKIKAIQHSPAVDSLNASSSSIGVDDSRAKSGKIARKSNVRELAKENKKREVEIRNLEAQLRKKQQVIEELKDKLKDTITFDLSDSLTLSASTTSLNIDNSTASNLRISKALLGKLDETIRNKQEEIQKLSSDIGQYQLEIDILKAQVPEQNYEDLKTRIQQLEEECAVKDRNIAVFKSERDELKKGVSDCQALKENITSLERKIRIKDQEIILLKQQNKAMNYTIEDIKELYEEQLRQEKQQKILLKDKVIKLEQIAKNIQQDYVRAQEEVDLVRNQMNQKEELLLGKLKESQKTILNSQVPDAEFQSLKAQLEANKEKIHKLLTECQKLASENRLLADQLFSTEKALQLIKEKEKQTQSRYMESEKKSKSLILGEQFHRKYPYEEVTHLFNGEILEGHLDEKKFLKQCIHNRYRRNIYRTKLLYRYDQLNKVNFHKYIDNKQNLLVLVKLPNGFIVGGYYDGKIHPKVVSDKDALLFCVTNRQTYELIEANRRGIAYDEFFFIIGNSELRIKFSDKKFFSNFGINNSFFNARTHRLVDFTGGNNREVDFSDVEFYEIVYI